MITIEADNIDDFYSDNGYGKFLDSIKLIIMRMVTYIQTKEINGVFGVVYTCRME